MVHDYCGGPVERTDRIVQHSTPVTLIERVYRCMKCHRRIDGKEVKNLPDIEPEGV